MTRPQNTTFQITFGLLLACGLVVFTCPCSRAGENMTSRIPVANKVVLNKSQILDQLKAIQNRQIDELVKTEDAVKKRLQESTAISLQTEPALAKNQIATITERLAELDKKRGELLARRSFTDQLILLVDSKWNGQPLQAFFESQLLDISLNDLTNTQGSTGVWKFATYLSVAIREIPEPHENILNLIESYMNFSGVTNPRTPIEFASSRSYTAGGLTYSALPVKKDDIGNTPTRAGRISKNKPGTPDIELHMQMTPEKPTTHLEPQTDEGPTR